MGQLSTFLDRYWFPATYGAVPSLRVEWFAGGAKGISSAKNTNNLSTSQRAEFKSDFKKREAWQSARVAAYLRGPDPGGQGAC